MAQRLKQVVLTYATRRLFWIIGGLGAILFMLGTFEQAGGGGKGRQLHGMSLFAAVPPCVAAFVVAIQAKLQFAHPRARLMPGFALPHLALPALGLLLGALAIPMLVSYHACGNVLPIASWASCLAASLVWTLYLNSGLTAFLTLGIGYSGAWPRSAVLWGLSGETAIVQSAWVLCLLLAAAWAAITLWLARLYCLHEQMDEYEARIHVANWERGARTARLEGRQIGVLQRKPAWRFTSWYIDAWHDRIQPHHPQGMPAGLFLYRYGFGAQPGWMQGTSLALVIVVSSFLFEAIGIFGRERVEPPAGSV